MNLRKQNIRYDQWIPPIPEYKTSKYGAMYTTIICKDKSKEMIK